ncbi:MAG: hypothetical protein AAB289_02400 [Chloroflexota bacterium]
MISKPAAGAAYGWKARFGLLAAHPAPENIPFEFYLMAPPGVTLIITSQDIVIPQEARGTPDLQAAYDAAVVRAEKAVGELASRHPDVLLQLGLPTIVTKGWGQEEVYRQRMAKITSIPLVTSIGASIDAMRALTMKRIAVMNPFTDYINGIPEYLHQAGIEVVGHSALRAVYDHDFEIEPTAVTYRAVRALRNAHPDCDGIWVTGASTPVAAIIDEMERDLGIPVVTNLQALIWAGLKTARLDPSEVQGFGQLFSR